MVASIKSESEDVMATAASVEMTWIEGFSEDRLHVSSRQLYQRLMEAYHSISWDFARS
jgi:hypothetical protein